MKSIVAFLLLVIGGNIFAGYSKGILPLVVQVVDGKGNPIENATVSLPEPGLESLAKIVELIQLPPEILEPARRPATTDKLGFAIIYYSGGMSAFRNPYKSSFECSLPPSIIISREGRPAVTIDLTNRRRLLIEPAESVVPLVRATLD